jgi:hypothetical protein
MNRATIFCWLFANRMVAVRLPTRALLVVKVRVANGDRDESSASNCS